MVGQEVIRISYATFFDLWIEISYETLSKFDNIAIIISFSKGTDKDTD